MESQEKLQQARDLFLHTDKTQTEIADILDVNRKTIYLWCKKGKWEQMKEAILMAPSASLHHLYKHIDRVNKKIAGRPDECPIMQDVEMLRKLTKMIKDIPKMSTGTYIEAFEDFSFFLSRRDPEFVKKCVPYADEFIRGTVDSPFRPSKRISENIAAIELQLKKDAERAAQDEADELVFDGLKFVPVKKNATDNAPQSASCELPTEKLASPKDEVLPHAGKDGAFTNSPEDPSKAATVNTSTSENSEIKCPISPAKKSDANGTFAVGADPSVRLAEGTPNRSTDNEAYVTSPSPLERDGDKSTAAYYATLPPEKRPAPFREGNIIYINHPKDLDDYEKHLKMSDTIRYYSDISGIKIK